MEKCKSIIFTIYIHTVVTTFNYRELETYTFKCIQYYFYFLLIKKYIFVFAQSLNTEWFKGLKKKKNIVLVRANTRYLICLQRRPKDVDY